MSKEEFLKIRTCVLKVNIHCDGCKSKVKKILHKIDGVYTTKIDSELGKVTVSGNVDPATLIRKLGKSGKHAELWGAPKANQNQLNNQLKNIQIDHGKGGNNKGQKGGNNNQQQPKGGQQGQNQQQQLQQQLQQLQQMKGFQDLKLPQLKDLKVPFNKDQNQNQNQNQNQKAVKFNLPEEDDLSDDEFDDFDDDDFDDDDEFDDEMDDAPPHPLDKMKNIMGNGQMPNMMMNGQHPQLMNAQAKGGNGGNNGGNGKKGGSGGGGNIPVQVNDGKKGGGGNGNNIPIQGGGGGGKNGGKNGGGGGAQNKNGNNAHGGGGNANNNGNGVKKGGGMNDGVQGLPQMGNGFHGMGGGNVGQMGNMPMGQVPAVQGLPAAAMNAGGSGYFNGAGPEIMAGNPHYQQQLAAMMMNQQRANGNERFQPMMYARPPPAVNYMPPYPYPYPYPPPPDPYTHAFSDENPSSCNVM